ncbi:hypothetical protein [Desulfonema magnum]|uniref:Uncharacterized protein n=1 Tax=Desulfonema magnum TaxID=45655 RepID=A0A975GJU8_9BACT|nr:hypothetical protein [Desulfonema magnum]QTA84014.1 Uncharacterized protein dnm_000040 [Desulfonema magnum]
MPNIGKQLLDVPLDEMIKSMGEGIAEAQYRLDQTSLRIAQMMSGTNDADRVNFGNKRYSLLELGFTPTFYQFIDSVIEVKMSITMTTTSSSSGGTKYQARAVTVNASYSNRYQYSVEGCSLLRTKLVTVPPPGILEERIRELIETEQEQQW